MGEAMKLAVPDLISNSYFPAVAAAELGFFKQEGLDVAVELMFPVDRAYAALRDGAVDFVAGSAHSALAAFPQWQGVKLICAQAQGMYWFLVMHADLGVQRGDVAAVKGRSIGAAPWVEMGLRRLLDRSRHRPRSRRRPDRAGAGRTGSRREFRRHRGQGAGGAARSTAFGPTEWAPRSRCGAASARSCSMCGAATAQSPASTTPWRRSPRPIALIAQTPDVAAAAVRAIVATQAALTAGRDARHGGRAQSCFPPAEAELIAELIRRDLPYYDATITPEFVAGMNAFARDIGILKGDVPYGRLSRRNSHRCGPDLREVLLAGVDARTSRAAPRILCAGSVLPHPARNSGFNQSLSLAAHNRVYLDLWALQDVGTSGLDA